MYKVLTPSGGGGEWDGEFWGESHGSLEELGEGVGVGGGIFFCQQSLKEKT